MKKHALVVCRNVQFDSVFLGNSIIKQLFLKWCKTKLVAVINIMRNNNTLLLLACTYFIAHCFCIPTVISTSIFCVYSYGIGLPISMAWFYISKRLNRINVSCLPSTYPHGKISYVKDCIIYYKQMREILLKHSKFCVIYSFEFLFCTEILFRNWPWYTNSKCWRCAS